MTFTKAIRPAKDINGVRRSAFWHLGRRDHSEKELRDKIGRKTDNQQWIDAVINECFEYDYLNDNRFIENFIRAAQNKGFGITRIKRDLHGKGINTDKLSNVFAEDQYDYVASATSLLATKYNKRIANQSIKHKAMVFLQGKGHCFDNIFKAIDIHNETYPVDDCDYLSEAIILLSGKFKAAITERKLHDKATRFLLSRGYSFSDIKDAIEYHNKKMNEDLTSG